MPQSLVKFGLIPSLKEFADKINDSEKMLVEVLAFDIEERLTDLQEISLYRISQEWVNNILKYSDAEKITIQITKDEHEITLTIEDNGMGFDLEKLTESKGNGWKTDARAIRDALSHNKYTLDVNDNSWTITFDNTEFGYDFHKSFTHSEFYKYMNHTDTIYRGSMMLLYAFISMILIKQHCIEKKESRNLMD